MSEERPDSCPTCGAPEVWCTCEQSVQKHPDECPYIDRGSIPNPEFNKPEPYKDSKGTYIFYHHDDGFGRITNVQFCQLVGRKRDVFECLNKGEWERCTYRVLSVSHPSHPWLTSRKVQHERNRIT